MVRFCRCLDDVCCRCRQPRSSKLRSHHWGRRFCVGPRFECLQTKRCALLWSVSYPCSIFHALASRLFNASASIELQLPYRCPLVQEPEDSLSSRPFGRFPSSSAPAFSPARSLTPVPGSVRVTSANSQLSQFLQLTVLSSPFLAFQLALGDSQVWSQPLSSIYAGSHRCVRHLLSSASRAANPETPVALTRWSASTVISYSFRRTDSFSQLPTISRETPSRLRARSSFFAEKTSAPWSGLPGYPVLFSYRFTDGWGSLAGYTAPFLCIVTCTCQLPGYRIRL